MTKIFNKLDNENNINTDMMGKIDEYLKKVLKRY